MRFKDIQALLGWAFQIEATPMVRTQKYSAELPASGFSELTAQDLRTQAAMIMLKLNQLPHEQRAVLWALHLRRETEMLYLTTHTPCRWGFKTDLAIIRKWATGKGPGCREIGSWHQISFSTANRYQKEVIQQLEALMAKGYGTLEAAHQELLTHLMYDDRSEERSAQPALHP